MEQGVDKMRIYIRKIDKQCIEKQISYTKEILKDFLGNLIIFIV